MPHRRKKVDFFRIPPFYHFLWSIFGMSLTTVIALAPDILPYDHLWYLGRFLHYMAYDLHLVSTAICCIAWLLHFGEAAYAYTLCRKLHLTNEDTFKWTAQTFIVGFPSLLLLRAKRKRNS